MGRAAGRRSRSEQRGCVNGMDWEHQGQRQGMKSLLGGKGAR